MPIKIQTIYSCSNCGAQSQKWQGRCIECGQWGTLQEKTFNKKNQAQEAKIEAGKIINFSEIKSGELARVKTGIEEFAQILTSMGCEIISTGGTKKVLEELFTKLNV